jgi:hypothetical protein
VEVTHCLSDLCLDGIQLGQTNPYDPHVPGFERAQRSRSCSQIELALVQIGLQRGQFVLLSL